ncbi:MAG: flagellar motor switch protein FliG, partial [Desulfobacterales bacterium]|nr:flagellar motor switch protein FliG [Desulfobacterales bacterium]
DLQTAWKPFFPVRISYQRTEINPKFVAIVPQSETVVVVNLDVDMGKEPMAITLCIPYAMIKPAVFFFIAKEKLASPLARNIAGIVNIGYRATPLPSLVQKVTDGFKRGFAPPSPAPAAPPETGGAPGHGSLDSLKWLEPATVARHIKSEHPQTIALILAHLEEPEQTARVLKELPENLQADVAYRMAILESIPPGVITEIEEVLSRELKASGETPAGKVGGVESVAQVLNTMDKLTESRILATIEQSNPVLAMQIRELMFTFEDLVLLDPAGMQAVLKEIPQNELVLSLKTASDAVKEHIFTNMSERAAGMVRDALDALGTVRMADVDLAQQKLVKIARKLEEDGKIVISGAGSGDVAVDTKEKTTPDKKKPVKKKTVAKKTTGKTKSE